MEDLCCLGRLTTWAMTIPPEIPHGLLHWCPHPFSLSPCHTTMDWGNRWVTDTIYVSGSHPSKSILSVTCTLLSVDIRCICWGVLCMFTIANRKPTDNSLLVVRWPFPICLVQYLSITCQVLIYDQLFHHQTESTTPLPEKVEVCFWSDDVWYSSLCPIHIYKSHYEIPRSLLTGQIYHIGCDNSSSFTTWHTHIGGFLLSGRFSTWGVIISPVLSHGLLHWCSPPFWDGPLSGG